MRDVCERPTRELSFGYLRMPRCSRKRVLNPVAVAMKNPAFDARSCHDPNGGRSLVSNRHLCCAVLVEGNTEEDGFPIFMEMLGLSEFKLGIAIVNMRGSDFSTVSDTARLLLAYDIPCVVVLDNDAQQTAEDIERSAAQGELSNVRKVFRLSEGTIEDYYPLDIVAEVMNKEFTPEAAIEAGDFDPEKHGADRLSNFRKVMHKKGAGTATTYLKRQIGRTGTLLMKERGLAVPDEIRAILEEVEGIVAEEAGGTK